ncbi:MAG: exodeoxyribonuclease VII large subunit [Lachnospiraceae bacterium]
MEQQVYSVAQVNAYIRNLFTADAALSRIYIKGEVSNCKYHSSGHIYFTLKDGSSALACVMFSGSRGGLRFTLADGQSVIAGGSISVYERDGKYQLYAREIIPDGAGALYEEYERLKMKLYEEGLFDHERKKPIPAYPKKVGIVTAKTGAAIRDIMSIAKRRNPYVQLYLYPAKVQGEGAALTIARGIRVLDRMGLDTIIIGRGGGSIEDLWAFNEEIVARAIYEAQTPIISGTGHESDTTIADYAADLRAATPSAATELAIPDVRVMIENLDAMKEQLHRQMSLIITQYRMRTENAYHRLGRLSPQSRLHNWQQYLVTLQDALQLKMHSRIQIQKHHLEIVTTKLHGLAPTAKLMNGYGYISKEEKPVTHVSDVQVGDELRVTMLDGNLYTKVSRIEKGDDVLSS